MELRLDILIQNTVLRLYRAPKGSQLTRRLGEHWHIPSSDQLPLPTPTRSRAVTTLRTLASKVPPGGPQILAFPEIPPDAPSWNGQVQLTPKQTHWDYTVVSNTLTESCREGDTINIYCDAVLSNKNRNDGNQLCTTAAVLYHAGIERGHTENVLGQTLTTADALTHSITPGLSTLSSFLDTRPADTQTHITFLIPSGPALNRMLDASPHDEQAAAINQLEKMGAILTTHPNISINVQWSPRKIPFVGFHRAKQLALEAIRTATLMDIEEPQTIKKQKQDIEVKAIAKWAERWHKDPRTSLAYRTALVGPPDGRTHHTFQPRTARDAKSGDNTQTKAKTKFTRLTHTTLYRFITGHAFTGEYTRRFYPPHTPEQVACPCGTTVQTIEHVLMDCPLYTAMRRKHLTANGRPQSLPHLFAKHERVQSLLCFLEETGACAKPRARWEPG